MYERIAGYYDLLHEELTEDIAFVLGLVGEGGGPVLELGCGTGRLLIPLLQAGLDVTGVDDSEEMLAIAREKLAAEGEPAQKRARLEKATLSGFQLEQRFGLAVIAYNTLMHLNPPELAFCLDNVHRHLETGGTLVIDVDNPMEVHDPGQDGLLILERIAYDPDRDEELVLMVSSIGDGERQTRDTVWIVDASPLAGGAINRTIARATLHYYFAHQLAQILDSARFQLIAQFGDYDRRPYDDESPRLLLLASAR